MKIELTIILFVILATVTAQPEKETKTILGNKQPHIGYFINPFCQFGNIAGSAAVLPGIGAGVMFNNKISTGVNYRFIVNENTPVGETDTTLYLDQFFTGIKCEYSIYPEKSVHLNFQVETGMGHTELDLKDSYEYEYNTHGDAWFAYLEPGAAIEINVWEYIKIDFAAGYRFVSNFSYESLSQKDFRGFTYSIGMKIGIF
ncbi:MAG: hypothetical protein IPH20_11885 [Bacteroidales bacterium]|nr:hypothetical protein [Bacteroidales bacterium]